VNVFKVKKGIHAATLHGIGKERRQDVKKLPMTGK
jgi:hypothetical protein